MWRVVSPQVPAWTCVNVSLHRLANHMYPPEVLHTHDDLSFPTMPPSW